MVTPVDVSKIAFPVDVRNVSQMKVGEKMPELMSVDGIKSSLRGLAGRLEMSNAHLLKEINLRGQSGAGDKERLVTLMHGWTGEFTIGLEGDAGGDSFVQFLTEDGNIFRKLHLRPGGEMIIEVVQRDSVGRMNPVYGVRVPAEGDVDGVFDLYTIDDTFVLKDEILKDWRNDADVLSVSSSVEPALPADFSEIVEPPLDLSGANNISEVKGQWFLTASRVREYIRGLGDRSVLTGEELVNIKSGLALSFGRRLENMEASFGGDPAIFKVAPGEKKTGSAGLVSGIALRALTGWRGDEETVSHIKDGVLTVAEKTALNGGGAIRWRWDLRNDPDNLWIDIKVDGKEGVAKIKVPLMDSVN